MRRSLQFVFTIVFFIVNTAAILIAYHMIDMSSDDFDDSPFSVMSIILILIHIISALVIKRKWDINFFRSLFIRSGGYAAVTFLTAELLLLHFNAANSDIWYRSDAAMWVMTIYLSRVIPALAVSGVITAVILSVSKKLTSGQSKSDVS